MPITPEFNRVFRENFFLVFKKLSLLKEREITALWFLFSQLIGSPFFSLVKTSERSKKRFHRNYLAQCLKKFTYIQLQVFKGLFNEIKQSFNGKTKLTIIVDDTLVKKSGSKIFCSFRWYDHCSGKLLKAIGIVTVLILVNGKPVLILPYILQKEVLSLKKSQYKRKQQDLKTKLAIEYIRTLMQWFIEYKINFNNVLVIADAWYSSRTFITFLKELGVKFRIDSRTNYKVLLPLHPPASSTQPGKRGRKRQHWIKEVRLDEFFLHVTQVFWFRDTSSDVPVMAKRAIIRLNTQGRVMVYAFWRSDRVTVKYILVPIVYTRPPAPKTVYYDYTLRWTIETAHRNLKQQFGLGKNQQRDAWAVWGFIGVVFFGYSIWLWTTANTLNSEDFLFGCPSWAETFHVENIMAVMASSIAN